MKQLSVIVVLILAGYALRAQDFLHLYNSDKIEVKVLSTDSAWIEYREYEDEKKRVRKIDKKAVLAIKYENGVLTDAYGAPLSIKSFDTQRYSGLSEKYKRRGIMLTSMGATFLAGGATLIAVSAYKSSTEPIDTNQRHSIYPMAIAFGTMLTAAGVPLSIIGTVYLGKYAKYKRKAANTAATLSFEPVLVPSFNARNNYVGGSMRITF